MPISESRIRDLAGFKGEDAPVTSVYLDVDGRRRIRARDYELALERMVRPERERERARHEGKASVWADLKRIEDHVKGGVDRSRVRGLAVFSCSAHDFWEVIELAVPVRDRLVVNHSPYVRELEAVVARHERFAVLVADRQRARLFLFHQGELLDKQDQFDVLPRHEDDGGQMGKDQVAGHTAAAAHRHLRHAAAAAFAFHQEQGFDHLALAGPDEITAELERELHPYLRERIAARIHLPVTAADDDIRAALEEVEAAVERTREAAIVERLRQAVGSGTGGVAGLDGVLEALVARRVDTLVVSEDFEAPGWRCPSCAWVGTRGRRCPLCESDMDQVGDVVEEAVEEALAQACRVAICRGDADLDVLGRVGALLRY
jgi:peptide chain release factor subunit 1